MLWSWLTDTDSSVVLFECFVFTVAAWCMFWIMSWLMETGTACLKKGSKLSHTMQMEDRKWFEFSFMSTFSPCMEKWKNLEGRYWKNSLSILGLPSGWAESDYAGVWSDHLVKLVLCGFVYVTSASSKLLSQFVSLLRWSFYPHDGTTVLWSAYVKLAPFVDLFRQAAIQSVGRAPTVNVQHLEQPSVYVRVHLATASKL